MINNQNKGRRDDNPRVNDEIDSDQLRIIDAVGENIGVISRTRALELAAESGLDLVEISPNISPPVAKIMDYGKYKYERQKKRHEAKKKQKTIDIKEIKLRPNIEEHDYQVKLTAAKKFIEQGNKVKVTLRFRGREMHHREIGEAILKRIQEDLIELAKPEFMPKLEERQVVMVLVGLK